MPKSKDRVCISQTRSDNLVALGPTVELGWQIANWHGLSNVIAMYPKAPSIHRHLQSNSLNLVWLPKFVTKSLSSEAPLHRRHVHQISVAPQVDTSVAALQEARRLLGLLYILDCVYAVLRGWQPGNCIHSNRLQVVQLGGSQSIQQRY